MNQQESDRKVIETDPPWIYYDKENHLFEVIWEKESFYGKQDGNVTYYIGRESKTIVGVCYRYE